jgi:hypothetical protein
VVTKSSQGGPRGRPVHFLSFRIFGTFAVFYLFAAPAHYYLESATELFVHRHPYLDALYDPLSRGILYLIAISILIEAGVRLYSYASPKDVSTVAQALTFWIFGVTFLIFLCYLITFALFAMNVLQPDPAHRGQGFICITQILSIAVAFGVVYRVHRDIVNFEDRHA